MIRSSLQDSIYDTDAGSGLAVRVALSHGYSASPMIIPAAKIIHPQSDRKDACYLLSSPKSRLTALSAGAGATTKNLAARRARRM
jgi:hypothetical protein